MAESQKEGAKCADGALSASSAFSQYALIDLRAKLTSGIERAGTFMLMCTVSLNCSSLTCTLHDKVSSLFISE